MKVYVVTSVELNWNCVCGVFSTIESLAKYFFGTQEPDAEKRNKKYNIIPKIEADIDEFYVIHEKIMW